MSYLTAMTTMNLGFPQGFNAGLTTEVSAEAAYTKEIPKVTVTKLRWQQYSWTAYKLTTGELVFSDRQMALAVGQSKKAAQDFVRNNNLNTILVQLPNRTLMRANPLSTVAAYWKSLLALDLITNSSNLFNWEEFLEWVEKSASKFLKSESPISKFKIDTQNLKTVVSAQPIKLQLQDELVTSNQNLELEVLVLFSGEYRISYQSGLAVIGTNLNWLKALKNSPRKLRALENKGFSGLSKLCYVHTSSCVREIETLSIDDWLTIWEYFANHNNTKASAVLKACAKESIQKRAASAATTGFNLANSNESQFLIAQ
ncbi:hypothetical protein [Tolypothrix sp. NIES-4075]|uniref:hypothetical protein n=1 Tax=Tolypothrix sp. NIES-4075 TaxID=2005459 RepID=UPI00117E7DD9|nr:hypothetical protein [Tolypothrix sp. NIES-4075]